VESLLGSPWEAFWDFFGKIFCVRHICSQDLLLSSPMVMPYHNHMTSFSLPQLIGNMISELLQLT